MDITSLYTVIPNGEGLLALKHFFDLRTVKEPSLETLLRLAELVLTLTIFHLEEDNKDASKPVARHFNLPNHTKQHKSLNSKTKIYLSHRHS